MAVAILVDEMTASAAEIFAGVLQHHGRARLFGRRTYGKGDAYRLAALPLGDAAPERPAMVPAGAYRLPDGRSLDGGLHPDVETDEPEAAARAWLRGER
jgi:carboxyl-terminal processing protease